MSKLIIINNNYVNGTCSVNYFSSNIIYSYKNEANVQSLNEA